MSRRLMAEVKENILLYDFLRLNLGLTRKQIRQVKFHEPGILVNGEKAHVTWKLEPGDTVEVDVEGHAAPKPLYLNPAPLEILYEDEDLIAVNKPSGVPSHPGGIHQTDTLVNMLMYYFHEKGESLVVRPAGRLDKETSGVILFSKNQAAAGRLVRQRERGLFRKEYIAAAEGVLPDLWDDGVWHEISAPIRRDPGNACRVIIDERGKEARTRILVTGRESGMTFIRARILTGRMHQIRIHMAYTGHPLIGDPLYGHAGSLISRTALHAESLALRQPFTDEALLIRAPLPADMQGLLMKENT